MTLNRGFLFAALVVVAAVGNASAATYIVGDTMGWTVPPTPAAYSTWASRHVFRVGDVLVFNYTTGFHDVAHVTKAAYDGCSSNNPIALATVGPSNFTLGSAGQDYYICTFGTHCVIGQKLAINVTAATPAPAPTMPPSTTPTPTMPPTTTPVTPTPTMPPTTTPTPTMPPSTTPTPTMTPMSPPSSSPSLSPSGTPAMTPGSPTPAMTPGSPMPSGGVPPPAPSSESTPGGSSSPPAPSSATVASVYAPLAVFASVLFALVI